MQLQTQDAPRRNPEQQCLLHGLSLVQIFVLDHLLTLAKGFHDLDFQDTTQKKGGRKSVSEGSWGSADDISCSAEEDEDEDDKDFIVLPSSKTRPQAKAQEEPHKKITSTANSAINSVAQNTRKKRKMQIDSEESEEDQEPKNIHVSIEDDDSDDDFLIEVKPRHTKKDQTLSQPEKKREPEKPVKNTVGADYS